MKKITSKAYKESHSLENSSSKDVLQKLLSTMHALYWNYNTSHWQSKGEGSYSNHLLFQRLYESMKDEFDTLAEKLVAYFGSESVDQSMITSKSKEITDKWNKETDLIDRCLEAEKDLQKLLLEIYSDLQDDNDITLGLDDYLMSLANAHETNIYLLEQNKS